MRGGDRGEARPDRDGKAGTHVVVALMRPKVGPLPQRVAPAPTIIHTPPGAPAWHGLRLDARPRRRAHTPSGPHRPTLVCCQKAAGKGGARTLDAARAGTGWTGAQQGRGARRKGWAGEQHGSKRQGKAGRDQLAVE